MLEEALDGAGQQFGLSIDEAGFRPCGPPSSATCKEHDCNDKGTSPYGTIYNMCNEQNRGKTRQENPCESMQMDRDLEEEKPIIHSYLTPPLDTNPPEYKPLQGAMSLLRHGCNLLSGNTGLRGWAKYQYKSNSRRDHLTFAVVVP